MIEELAVIAEESSAAWYTFVNRGGEFFSQFVFTLLASIILSDRWRDYLIDPQKNHTVELRQALQSEIEKVILSTRLDSQFRSKLENTYAGFLQKVDLIEAKTQKSTNSITNQCRFYCIGLLLLSIVHIATDWNASTGPLCLVFLAPVPICRFLIRKKNDKYQAELHKIRTQYETVMETCQDQYVEEMSSGDEKMLKFSKALR